MTSPPTPVDAVDADLDEPTAALAAVLLELGRGPAPRAGRVHLHGLAETEVLRERVPTLAAVLPPPGRPGALTALEEPDPDPTGAPDALDQPEPSTDPVVARLARQRWRAPVVGAAISVVLPSDPTRLVVAGVLADGRRWGVLREPDGALRGGSGLAPGLCDLLLATFDRGD